MTGSVQCFEQLTSIMNDKSNKNSLETESVTLSHILSFFAGQLVACLADAQHDLDNITVKVLETAALSGQLMNEADGANTNVPKLFATANDAALRLQTIDRLSQRVENVRQNLSRLSLLVKENEVNLAETSLTAFLMDMESNFKTLEDRLLFAEAFDLGDESSDRPVMIATELF